MSKGNCRNVRGLGKSMAVLDIELKDFFRSPSRIEVFGGGKCQNGNSSNITQNKRVCMDWVDRPQIYKGLY